MVSNHKLINLTAALLLLTVLVVSVQAASKTSSSSSTNKTKTSGVDEKPKAVFKIPKQELKKEETKANKVAEIVYKELDSANRSLANFGRTKRQAQSKLIQILY